MKVMVLYIPKECKGMCTMSRNKYPELTVEKILDVSKTLFLTKGYEETTIQDIVNELGGLSKGAIYHHFKSKEDILRALESRIFEENNPFLSVERETGLTGLQKLQKAIILNQENQTKQDNNQITKKFIPLLKNPHILASMLESNRKYLSPYFLKLMEEGVSDGSIQTKYAKELSELIPLLEIWLMPSVYPASEEELFNKIFFIKELFEHMGVSLFSEESLREMEIFLKNRELTV